MRKKNKKYIKHKDAHLNDLESGLTKGTEVSLC